ncbi:MAG: Hsp70 family protein [Pseudomonadota bacterium]
MESFVVGIDLGTTNTVVASSPCDRRELSTFAVPQLVSPGEHAKLPTLPSCLYLPGRGEFAADATALPWGDNPGYFLGHFAALHGAKVPGRTVLSAKSWLSYAGVDRGAAILPWGAGETVAKISPVEASARVLRHLTAAWDHAHPEAPLAEQEVILTVPASFDEVARHLTSHAAVEAGLRGVRLLEEPQAAFYDFLDRHRDGLLDALGEHRLILVVDVGGGTTDFTLVEVRRLAGQPPQLERVAVGDHLMLGGDNMDATLARHVEQQLTGSIGSLNAAQWGALVQSARLAKEALLGREPPAEFRIVLPGRGTRLVGAGQSHPMTRDQAQAMLIDGFLPLSAADQEPERRERLGLAEFGLPYAADPALSHHICGFLRRHAETAAAAGARIYAGLPRPDAVLLNGGVFNSAALRQRLGALLSHWYDGEQVPVLDSASLDLAVARGAAAYGLVRRGHGLRIGGGSPRAYYVGVEDARGQRQALCVAPRGMLEGSQHEVDRTFRLRLGQPVSFPLYSSTGSRRVAAGALGAVDDELAVLPPLQTVLQPPGEVPVRLRAALTEVGTLEISLHMTDEALSDWGLSFSTRDEGASASTAPSADSAPLHHHLDEAKGAIERCYGDKSKDVDTAAIKGLMRQLEKLLGARDSWSTALSRELFGTLLVGARRRRRSADHERLFFQLAGYCLRPGFGAPFDDWRIGELWKLCADSVQYTKDKPVWAAWWIQWRRVAGGLDATQQRALFDAVWPWLNVGQSGRPKGPRPHAEDEMVRLLAALERLPPVDKQTVGEWVLRRLSKGALSSWWPIGRLGARQPFAGSAHEVLSISVAEDWLSRLLGIDWKAAEGATFAAVQLARRTGDRERDIDDQLRDRVARKLAQVAASAEWIQQVREVGSLSAQDEAQVFGDSLPVGLRLG